LLQLQIDSSDYFIGLFTIIFDLSLTMPRSKKIGQQSKKYFHIGYNYDS